ncbi:Phage-related protein [uncultured Faecalibacterium sp.]|nr:Phage-related protein [uncultured Faecalibacterium sp.]
MYALKAATLALNMVFAMFAGWVISAGMNAFINWMKNAKTHSEQLISTMEDAHDAAEEAQQDVDDIQQKLDDLDQKVKDLGAEKIEDIVDPQEKAKIQEINNLLETQLRLKKQIADDENNKANKAASDVFNDKSEVVVSNETPTSYAEADPNGIGVTVTPSKNVTRTEALREHTARVNELSDAYVKLMSDENATDEERAQAKKNLEDEISLTNDAGTKVSELADMYETDASKYGDVSSEVQECTDSMQGASDALERANNLLNGTTSVENTNLDAFKSKFKDVIEEIDNGYLSMQEAIAQYKDLSPLQAFGSMTGEAIINIDSDTAHQTEAEATALAKLHEIADANNISFEDLIGAFEQLGIVATSDTSGIANYATQLEETMKAIDSLQSSYKSCSSAVEEYNKYGYLSTDTMQSLLQMDTEYLNCLDLKDGKLQINKQRYAELLAAQYAQTEMEAIEQAITELNTIAKEDSAEKTESLTTATEEEKNKLVALCPALKDATTGTGELAAALAAAQGAANGDNTDEVQAKIDSVMNALNTKLTLLHNNMNAAINNGNALSNQLGGFSNSTKSASKSVSDAASAFDTLSKAMKEYNQYGYICADTMKSLAGLEDKYTACLTEQNGKLVLNTAQFRKFIKTQLEEANAADDGGKSAGELNKILDWLNSSVDSETISFEQLTDAIKGYGTAMDEAKEKTDAIKSAFSDLYDVGTQKKDNDFGFLDMDAIEKQYQAVRNLYENTDLFTNPKYASALNSETGEVDYNSDAFKQMFADHLKELAASARETGGAAGEYLAQGFEDAAAKIANNVMSIRECIDGIGSSLNYATDRIDHFQSGFSDISDIVTQYNTYGGLSIDNYQKLMSLDDDYIKCLSLEGNQLKFNTEAYKELFIAKLNAMIDEYDAADETKALAQRLRELRDAVIASGDGFTSAEDKAKNFETTLGNIKSLLSDLIGVFEKFNENKSNDLKIQGDAWIDVIDKRIDALNEENDAQERAIELAKLQDEYERAKANKTVHVYGGRGQGFVWKADENAVREAGQNLSDKQREYKKKDEIDRLNKLKDKIQEANNLIGTSWDDYQKKLKYTAEFEAMTFEQMEGHYDGFKNSILDNMRDIQSATNVSDAITNLEKLINTLKTLNDVITFFTSGGVSTDGGGIFGLFNQIKNMFTGENGDFDLGGGFKKMFDGAAKVVSDGWNWITGKNRAGSAALKSDTTATLDILGNTIKVNTGDIQRVSGGFFERLVGAAKDNLGSIGKFFSGA